MSEQIVTLRSHRKARNHKRVLMAVVVAMGEAETRVKDGVKKLVMAALEYAIFKNRPTRKIYKRITTMHLQPLRQELTATHWMISIIVDSGTSCNLLYRCLIT